jgi:small nuclear ribonucleoprotein (snRNP)-like protein
MSSENEAWGPFVGKRVVIDTNSSYVYIGTLAMIGDHFIVLHEVDVHDRHETPSTKERYVMEAKKYGVKANRKEVSVRKIVITSLSLLDDIVDY